MALLGLSTTFAQTPTPAHKTEKKTTTKVQTTPTTHKAATGLKKNGTPDMRLKANKTKAVAKAKGPVKKNGTPDMRYKENKKH